jgi:hypothetical protein
MKNNKIEINTHSIYHQSLKLVNDAYRRLLKIRKLPQGSLSSEKGNFYWEYPQNNQILTKKKLSRREWQNVKKQIKQRQELSQINKKIYEQLKKSVKLLALFNKELSFLLNDEIIAYRLDSIPVNERIDFIMTISVKELNAVFPMFIKKYFNQWIHGKISARLIMKRLLQKTAN